MGIEAPLVDGKETVVDDGTPSWITRKEPVADSTVVPPVPGAPPAGQTVPPPQDDSQVGFQKRIDVEVSKRKALEDRLAKLEGGNGSVGGPAKEEGFKFEAYEGFKQKFLAQSASTPEGAQAVALFDGLHQAITADFSRAIEAYIADQLAPYQQFRTSVESDGFYKTNPTAQAKRDEVESYIQKYPGMPREEAWKLVNYGAPTGPARPQRVPPPGSSPRTPGAPMGGQRNAKTLEEAIALAERDRGLS